MRYTNDQIIEQKKRFEAFCQYVNLLKIGDRYVYFQLHADGAYNEHVYIHRILRLLAKVEGSMYHPEQNRFYSDILKLKSLTAATN